MILGIGVDLFENNRLQRELTRAGWRPSDGVFTPREIQDCKTSASPTRRYAICFTAKEAALKALGVSADLETFRQVEVGLGADGHYTLNLKGAIKSHANELGVHRMWLSVAQSATQTGAMVILER